MFIPPNDPYAAVIFDLDHTLVDGEYQPREPELARVIRELSEANKPLFIVSATDPVPAGTDPESYVSSERERKMRELEAAGISPGLFQDVLIASLSPTITFEDLEADFDAAIAMYADSKRRAMEAILTAHDLRPEQVLSIGDRADLEGKASRDLGIPFVEVPAAGHILPSDTLSWILRSAVLGERQPLPGPRRSYSEQDVRALCGDDAALLQGLMHFQSSFQSYVKSRLWRLLQLKGVPIPELDAPNFNQYKGHLEMAWSAAKALTSQYDLIIGIARKGLWLSYVFEIYGANVREIYLARGGGDFRTYCPISEMWERDVEGKRVLLVDNDALTGNSIRALSEHLKGAGASKVDVLLIYQHTEPEQLNESNADDLGFLDVPRVLGRRDNGKLILDSMPQLRQVRSIGSVLSLEKDFKRRVDRKPTIRAVARKLDRRVRVRT